MPSNTSNKNSSEFKTFLRPGRKKKNRREKKTLLQGKHLNKRIPILGKISSAALLQGKNILLVRLDKKTFLRELNLPTISLPQPPTKSNGPLLNLIASKIIYHHIIYETKNKVTDVFRCILGKEPKRW